MIGAAAVGWGSSLPVDKMEIGCIMHVWSGGTGEG